jgi:DNA-binding HxlR family transcriptional regulator
MSSIDPIILGQLGRHRWAVALIATLAERKGGRFVELLQALGTNRESLSRTLDSCSIAGWVMRNPGYGHPLRPEYILTEAGMQIASLCQSIEQTRRSIGLGSASLSRWSLPIIRRIDLGARRFNMIGHGIKEANPRALTQSLKSLIGQELITRTVVDAYPPVPEYGLSDTGDKLARAMSVLQL